MNNKSTSEADRAAKEQLDDLIEAFFRAFDNTKEPADLSALHDMLLPQAIIVNNTNEPAAIYTPDTFIPPRQEMFDNGVLDNFKEWEIEEDTVIIGRVAHRRSLYGKSGMVNGQEVNCVGHKSFQFIHAGGQWWISALSWWDEI